MGINLLRMSFKNIINLFLFNQYIFLLLIIYVNYNLFNYYFKFDLFFKDS